MELQIASAAVVRERLSALDYAAIQRVADASGVPFTTLLKIRGGETKNPGIETVRKFVAHLPAEAKST